MKTPSLRKHQIELDAALELWKKEEDSRDKKNTTAKKIIMNVTPGGGKGCVPLMVCKSLMPNYIDKICHVVPRVTLQQQSEKTFTDKDMKKVFGSHAFRLQRGENIENPSNDENGYTLTYHSLGKRKSHVHSDDFDKHRYALILDEFHHIAEDSAWGAEVQKLIDKATIVIFMSGSFLSEKTKKIDVLPYIEDANGNEIFDLNDPNYLYINYTRKDARNDKAIIRTIVNFVDGELEYQDSNSNSSVILDSFDDAKTIEETRKSIFTALRSQYANDLLDRTIASWNSYKTTHPTAKLLVVAATQELARNYIGILQGKSYAPELAISDLGSNEALTAINKFKKDKDILVTVGMAYEGLDVPAISHIVCLTHIRSVVWIEQMIARAVRVNRKDGLYEDQTAFIFAPNDQMIRKIIADINLEAPGAIQIQERDEEQQSGENGKQPDEINITTPISGKATDESSHEMVTQKNINSVLHSFISETYGKNKVFSGKSSIEILEVLSAGISREKIEQEAKEWASKNQKDVEKEEEEKTPYEIKASLKKEIDNIGKQISKAKKWEWKKINAIIKQKFKKPKKNMNIQELQNVKNWLSLAYKKDILCSA